MKAIVKAEFLFDVTEWFKDEGLTKQQRIDKIEEELSDFSVFMPLSSYDHFEGAEVEVFEHIPNKLTNK